MRTVVVFSAALFGVLASSIFAPSPSTAESYVYPWCAYYGGRSGGGGTNCYFSTYQQCMAALSGNGGYCDRNPMYLAGPPREGRRIIVPRAER